MPSTALQSRISDFESLSLGQSSSLSPSLGSSSSPLSPPANIPPRHHAKSPPITRSSLLDTIPPPTKPSISRSPSPSPPNLGRKTSLIDLKDWVLDDGPSSSYLNGQNLDDTRTPTQGLFNPKMNKFSNLSTPVLINLESPPKPKPKPKPKSLQSPDAPPLPPRKPSFTSLKSVASSSSLVSHSPSITSLQPPRRSDSLAVDHSYPPLVDSDFRSRNSSGHAPASSISSFHSVSLSSDTDPSTPGSVANFIATFPMDHDREYAATSNGSEAGSTSLGESYEDVSTSSLASPATERMITLDWEKAMAKRKAVPPKLPQRPSSVPKHTPLKSPPPSRSSIAGPRSTPGSPISRSPSSSSVATATSRRIPPPPPSSRASDRSSIQSTATSFSISSNSTQPISRTPSLLVNSKTKRPTPVPPAARKRFEGVFNANVVQRRRAEMKMQTQSEKDRERPALLSPNAAREVRRAAGWRGLSVDLITGGEDSLVVVEREDKIGQEVGNEERLEGGVVGFVWSRSGLDKGKLRDIWAECDTLDEGALDRDAFVRGMWRIDEELRRAQTQATKSSSGSLRMRKPPPRIGGSGYTHYRAVQKPKDILR